MSHLPNYLSHGIDLILSKIVLGNERGKARISIIVSSMQVLSCGDNGKEVDDAIDKLFFLFLWVMSSYLQLMAAENAGKVIVAETTDNESGNTGLSDLHELHNSHESKDIHDSDSDDIVQIYKPPSGQKRKQAATDLEKMYRQYTVCRSFLEATYQQHINLNLINKRSRAGLIVLCPHMRIVNPEQASSQYGSRILSILKENGNMSRQDHRFKLDDLPYLSRCIPSTKDLNEKVKLTEELKTKRGPGRPFGTYAPKRTKKEMKQLDLDSKTKRKSRAKRVRVDLQESVKGSESGNSETTPSKESGGGELRSDITSLTDLFDVHELIRS